MSANLPCDTVTFLFTDIEGSTRRAAVGRGVRIPACRAALGEFEFAEAVEQAIAACLTIE